MRNIIKEYRQKKALCRQKYGIYPKFGEKDSSYAHRVAIHQLHIGVDMLVTQTEVMKFLGYRLETKGEQMVRLVNSEVQLAIRQGIPEKRYHGDVERMTLDIWYAFEKMKRLDRPKWVKKEK